MGQKLKQLLKEHYEENEDDFEAGETKEVMEILKEYDDKLTNLNRTDYLILGRLVNDEELQEELDQAYINGDDDSDPFGEEDEDLDGDKFWSDDEY